MNTSLNLLKSDFTTILKLLFSAKKQVLISVPNITSEIAHSLVSTFLKGIDVLLFLEFSENTYRNGYGDIEAIDIIQKTNIRILNKNGFNIYFFIIDDFGYFYFPKSSFHEKEGIAFDLFPMTYEQILQIKILLRVHVDEDEDTIDKVLEQISTDQLNEISSAIKIIGEEEQKFVLKKLSTNPPLKPYFARTLDVYKAKFQYVDLKFKGANINSTKVKLPAKALPFKDNKLKNAIEANLKLFTNLSEKDFLNDFFEIKDKIKELRDKYLFHIKIRDKSILPRDQRIEFENEIKSIVDDISETKTKILNKLQGEINNARKGIENSLYDFLLANPPDNSNNLFDDVLEDNIKYEVSKIITKIKFPDASSLLDDMKLDYYYYDITWEDLNNKDFQNEMLEKHLLSENEKTYIDSLAIEAKVDK
jgi:hypothetical protein